MFVNKVILLIIFLLNYYVLLGQGTTLPIGSTNYVIINRLEILKNIEPTLHSSIKYYSREEVVKYALAIDSILNNQLSKRDKDDLNRIYIDNNEWLSTSLSPTVIGGKHENSMKKIYTDSTHTFYNYVPSNHSDASLNHIHYIKNDHPILGIFYRTPANFFEVNNEYFYLRLNPILNFQINKEVNKNESEWLFINQRGIELRGGVDDRIYFYTNIFDTQAKFPDYTEEFIKKFNAIPANGLYKKYNSSILKLNNSYDYLNGQGYVGLNVTKHVGLQFGHGRNFIGNGYRSLLLSDFSNNYLYLKLNWKLGNLRYQNLFAEISATSANAFSKNKLLPKKYIALHYLSYQHNRNFSFGFFEATVFNRAKETGQFELQYLNPVILYRTVEHLLDSPDNLLLGFDLKINIFNHLQVYGQTIIDEFRLSKVTGSPKGWWGNKFGIQSGIKYVNTFNVDHLDIQLEFNTVRPYTYTHKDSLGSSYSHYNQSLAHPLGSNFREYIGMVRYQPYYRWTIESKLIHIEYGQDGFNQNWGSNILLSNETRENEYGNKIGQGINTITTILGINLSFEIFHNFYFDVNYYSRNQKNKILPTKAIDSYIGSGLRLNISQLRNDF